MADSANTGDSSGIAKSFADRLSFPDQSANGTDSTPTKFSWADDATTPVQEKSEIAAAIPSEPDTPVKAAKNPESLGDTQKDGATEVMNGSGLDEPEFDVNVKLVDMQEDPSNPLYSVKTFKELNLYVCVSLDPRKRQC